MATQSALTSVIMVTYHTGPALFAAIESVLGQSEPVQLCLVDNGNPRDVVERLQAMAAEDARIVFKTGHGNVGFSKGCNLGAKSADGEFLLFLNPDSKLPPDTLLKLKLHVGKLSHPFMIGARVLNEDGTDQRGCRRALLTPTTAFIEALHLYRLFPDARLNFDQLPIPSAIAPIPAISGACMFLARQDFWHIGGFDEGYFLHVEDLDFCLRFRRAGGEIYFAPDVTVTHVGGTSSTTTAFIEKNKARGFIRYFHQNFGHQYPFYVLWLLDAAIWVRARIKIAVNDYRTQKMRYHNTTKK